MSFAQLGLTPDLLRAVARQNYTQPTSVQREAIPIVHTTAAAARLGCDTRTTWNAAAIFRPAP